MSGRGQIARRIRIFLGCEGESEQGYGRILQEFADDAGLHVHLVIKNLQPAGDPLSLAKKAVSLSLQRGSEERISGRQGNVVRC